MTTARKPATKRTTAKRKPKTSTPVGPPLNGAMNGNGHPEEPRPPEEHALRAPIDAEDTLQGGPSHPFGDRMIQVFDPSEGESIIVPHISTVNVTELFLWENEKRGLDLMHQSWRWLDLAGIPDDIQARVIGLPPADKRRFWEQWFEGFVPPPAGEPPGES